MKRIRVIFLLGIIFACQNDKNTPLPIIPVEIPGSTTPPTTNVICNPDTVYFKQKILPLIVSNCAMSGCHDAISKKDGVVLTDFTNIIK